MPQKIADIAALRGRRLFALFLALTLPLAASPSLALDA